MNVNYTGHDSIVGDGYEPRDPGAMVIDLWDLPDEDYRNGDPTEDDCGICGENITTNDEAGEFAGVGQLAGQSILAHAQCGLDHGLELA